MLASNTNWVYHKEKIQLSESIRLGPSVFDTGQKRCRESAVQRLLWTHADTPINLSEHKNSVQASYTENIQSFGSHQYCQGVSKRLSSFVQFRRNNGRAASIFLLKFLMGGVNGHAKFSEGASGLQIIYFYMSGFGWTCSKMSLKHK